MTNAIFQEKNRYLSSIDAQGALYDTWHSCWEKDFNIAKEIDYHLNSRGPFYELLNRNIRSFGNKKDLKILEIGSGTAIDSCIVSKMNGITVFCLDLFYSALKLAEKIAKDFSANLIFINSNVNKICFKDKSFDLIFSQGVLEHFRDYSLVMKEQVRLLKDGGILVIDVPQAYTLYTIVKHRKIKKNTWPFGWEIQFSYRDLVSLGTRYGLEPIDVCGHEYDSNVRFFNLALLRNIIKRMQKKNPLRQHTFFKKIESAYDSIWNILERKWGHYFLVNIAVAFKKKAK